MGGSRRTIWRLIPSLYDAARCLRTGNHYGTSSHSCRVISSEICGQRWEECSTSLCCSNIGDYKERHEYKAHPTPPSDRFYLGHSLSDLRSNREASNTAISARRSNLDIDQRSRFSKVQVEHAPAGRQVMSHSVGGSMGRLGDQMCSWSWLWQRHYSAEGGAIPESGTSTKKEGLQESKIGEELLTEKEAQSSESVNLNELKSGEGEDLSPEEVSLLKEAEAEYEKAQEGKGSEVSIESLEEILHELQANGDPNDSRTAIISLRLGQEYETRGDNPETYLRLGEQALKILASSGSFTAETGMCHHLIASAHHRMGQHEHSLENLKKALKLVESKEGKEYRPVMFAVRFALGDTMTALGKHEEALQHYVAGLAVQETLLDAGHPRLATNYRQVGEAFTQVMLFDEAKALVDKALEIHVKVNGAGSLDEAIDRRLLAVIHSGLEEHEKALEEQQIVKNILKEKNFGSEAVFVEIAMADTQITLARFEDAIASLQSAMSKLEDGGSMRALATANLAKAYAQKGDQDEAKMHSRVAIDILNSKLEGLTDEGPESLAVAECFTELAAIHERMNRPDEAIDLLKKALSVFQRMPQQLNAAAGSQAQIGMLLFFTGKVSEAVPYMEEAAKNLRQSFGDGHFSLALVLNHLAVAHVELENFVDASNLFEEAKGILSVTHGPGQQDTLAVYQNLVKVYSKLGRNNEAIANAKHIVTELQKQGDKAKEALAAAEKDLGDLENHKVEADGKLGESLTLHGNDST